MVLVKDLTDWGTVCTHEAEYDSCELNRVTELDKLFCNIIVDMNVEWRINYDPRASMGFVSVSNPKYTERYAFENNLPLPNFYNMTQADYEELKARNFKKI